jgi:hypothetical protein
MRNRISLHQKEEPMAGRPKEPTRRIRLSVDYLACLQVVDEFVRNVEARGEVACEAGWPDLFKTYLAAREIVRDAPRAGH